MFCQARLYLPICFCCQAFDLRCFAPGFRVEAWGSGQIELHVHNHLGEMREERDC
ncbi:hypothetical protein CUZ56_01770 [Saezia sanguinis]|uniref:Uncharacterized protein n=1 Tax=Saezia sanguinis TaxID=1965230 RepID=A0A433SCN7_9BURK|nr:hypothetical protein CUZ56_01770 [Saezia sanguinis]